MRARFPIWILVPIHPSSPEADRQGDDGSSADDFEENLASSEDESMSETESEEAEEEDMAMSWSPGRCVLDATGVTGSIPRMCLASR